MKKKYLFIITILLSLLTLTSCSFFGTSGGINKKDYSISRLSYYMYLDTVSTVAVEYKVKEKPMSEIEQELNVDVRNILLNIEKEFSISQTYYMKNAGISESTLMKINRLAGKEAVVVSDEFLDVLSKAQRMHELTNGGFDPTVGPLSRLWDIAGQLEYCNIMGECNIPSQDKIDEKLNLVDFNLVEINEKEKTVYLPKEGMMIDFGGIAKGYAADKVMEFLQPRGYTYISVNLGGNLYVSGKSKIYEADGLLVSSEIQNPVDSTTTIIRTYASDVTIVSSGTYERFIEVDGRRYHHILDPKTGYPFDNGLLMVSIIGTNSCICDGLSTGIFSLGLEDGIELIKSLEGYSAFFVTTDNKIYSVGNLEFELTEVGKANFELIKVE